MPEDLAHTAEHILRSLDGRPQSRQHIDGPRADRFAWQTLRKQSAALQTLEADHPDWPAWPDLLQDVFSTFYKMDPQLRDPDAVDPAVHGTRPYLERLLEEPQTATTRTQTQLDDVAAAIATLTAGQVLAEQITHHPELAQAMAQETPEPPPPTVQGQLGKAIRQATQAGGEAASEAQQTLLNWGMDGASLQPLGLGDRLALLDRLRTDRFRHFGDLIGRMRHLARTRQGGSLRHARDELHAIEQGHDLSRLLPAEAAMLHHPLRRKDFYRRWLEGQLQQYALRPIPRDGRGPILCAIDASGSMNGRPLEWAVAVALGLLDTARRQRRDFAAVYFNGAIHDPVVAPKGIMAADDLVHFAEHGAGGGTAFEPPLAWCLEQLQTARFRAADITMITDGASKVSDAFLQRFGAAKTEARFRVFALLIGGSPDSVAAWADRIWALGGTLDEDAAGALFEEMLAR